MSKRVYHFFKLVLFFWVEDPIFIKKPRMAHENVYEEIMRVVYNFDLNVVAYDDVKELLNRLELIRVDLCMYF